MYKSVIKKDNNIKSKGERRCICAITDGSFFNQRSFT
jgi:hypothetical protein